MRLPPSSTSSTDSGMPYGKPTENKSLEMHREACESRIQDINQCELGFDDDIPF